MTILIIFLLFLIAKTSSLNILILLNCNGGHFGTMTSYMVPMCQQHNCTVIETAKLCEAKLQPILETTKLHVMKRHGTPDEYTFEGIFDMVFRVPKFWLELNDFAYNELESTLKSNPGVFDLVVTEMMFPASLIIAEKFDMPVVVNSVAEPAAVESFQDKINRPLWQSLFYRLLFGSCFQFLYDLRAQNGLPEIDNQGLFSVGEYYGRFPMIIPGSPVLFPEPEPIAEFIYVGGMRTTKKEKSLGDNLENWIQKSDKDIVYVSLGTHGTMKKDLLDVFVKGIRSQNNYRVILSMGSGLEKVVKSSGHQSDDAMLFSGYLPQYNLLGNSKVKVFVTHAGLGSCIDLIKQETPSVFAPLFADQFTNSFRLTSANAGITVDNFDFDSVNAAVLTILSGYQKYVDALKKLNEEFQKFENVDILDNFIQKIASRGQVSMIRDYGFQTNSYRVILAWRMVKYGFYFSIILFVLLSCYLTLKCCGKLKPKQKSS